MRKKLLLIMLALCSTMAGALAQITSTAGTVLTVATYSAEPKVVVARNIWGAPLVSVFFDGDPDTTQAIIIMGTVVDSFYATGYYHAIVDLKVWLEDDSLMSYSAYRDTLTHGVELLLPATGHVLIRDSVLHVRLDTATGVSPADRFEVSIRNVSWDDLVPELRTVVIDSGMLNVIIDSGFVRMDTTTTIHVTEPPVFQPWE